MNSWGIRNNIVYNEHLVDLYTGNIRTLEDKLNELEILKNKIINLENTFADRQQQRVVSVQKFTGEKVRNRIFTAYVEGMGSLLIGNKFHQTYNELGVSVNKVNKKILEMLSEVENYEDQIRYRTEQNKYWEAQLRYVLEKESEGD